MVKVILILSLTFVSSSQAYAENCTRGSRDQRDLCAGTNQIRSENGESALQEDSHLDEMATVYAFLLSAHNKNGSVDITHNLPGYEFKKRMYDGHVALPCAENIAGGQRNVSEALKDWENSPGHFRNMTSASYNKIGNGTYNGFWVQIFSN